MKKRILSTILATLMVITVLPCVVGASGATTLQNLYKKLSDGNAKIAYLGGSVTYGSGATDGDTKSWRGLVGQWFEDNFPSAEITNVNAGVGATGTYFGSYRAYQDMGFDSCPPDLVFFEYAINDSYDGRTEAQVKLDTESIIRQIYEGNPYAQIIMLFTTDFEKQDSDFKELVWQRTIADHYGIPYLYMGKTLWRTIVAENGSIPSSMDNAVWHKYINDSCHPTDLGYEIYAGVVEDYLYTQLLDPDVERSTTAYTAKVLPETTIAGADDIKNHGRYISFSDAGFTKDDLNGFSLSGGSLLNSFENSSFAFTFTGTAVGFNNFGMPSSATLKYTITRTSDNQVVVPESEISLIKDYPGGLPYPAELATGLPEDEYRVDIIAVKRISGSDVNLKYIYINGDPESVSPAPAPESNVIYVPKYVSSVDAIYNGTGASGTIDGTSAITVVTPNTSEAKMTMLDNWSLASINISPSIYKYVGMRYYFDNPDNNSTVTENGFTICQLNMTGSPWLGKEFSQEIVSNKWTTVYFDISEYCDWLSQNYPDITLGQIYVNPFGDDNANTVTNGEKFYYGGLTFYAVNPLSGVNVHDDGNGNYYTYVSEDGSVTTGGETYTAFTRIEDAMTALLTYENATIYIDGEVTIVDGFTDVVGRGNLTIRGLGDTPADIAANKLSVGQSQGYYNEQYAIKNGDITFDYLTLTAPANELYSYAQGCTLTFGENIVVAKNGDRYMAIGHNYDANGGKVIINSGTYDYVIGGAGFGGGHIITGDVTYDLNGGTFSYIYGGSSNNYSVNTNEQNGNVYFNFNGGTYNQTMYLGSSRGDSVAGNIIFNVNGGTYSSGIAIAGGHRFSGSQSDDNIANTAVVFNSDTFTGNTNGLVLGRSGSGAQIIGKEIYIINNSEISTGVSIDSASTAEYRIKVENGKAVPVFASTTGGELLGFEITSDTNGLVPTVNGVALSMNAAGYYVIDENTTEGAITTITFAESDGVSITLSDGEGKTKEVFAQKNGEYILPVCTFTNSGYLFDGWSDGTKQYSVGSSYSVGTTPVTFTAVFIDKSSINNIYVSYTVGNDNNSGISYDKPVATFAKAFELVKETGTNDGGKIIVVGVCSVGGELTDLVFPATENNVTITGYNSTSEIAYSNYRSMTLNGPVTFENIRLTSTAKENESDIITNNWPIKMGDGVVTTYTAVIHAGQLNKDADRDTNVIINSGSFIVKAGCFYNVTSVKYAKNIDITVNGGTVRIDLGADGWQWKPTDVPQHKGSTLESVTITANGGDVEINKLLGLESIVGPFTIIKAGAEVRDNTGEIGSVKNVIIKTPKAGDLDGNGLVNAADIAIMRRVLLGIDTIEISVGDLNNDNKITVKDLVRIKKYAVQSI